MNWSYSGDPSASDLDAVRFYCGDTDADDPILSDEEVTFLLNGSTVATASVDACIQIVAKYSRLADYAIGPERVQASQRVAQYTQLAETLRQRWKGKYAAPSWQSGTSGVSRPLFDVGMHDNPETLYGVGITVPNTIEEE